MKLKNRLLLATSLTVLIVLAASEWLSYRHTVAFLQEHEIHMRAQQDHTLLVDALHIGQRSLLATLVSLHVIHAVITVLALIVVLNFLWYRLVIRRLDLLLRHINSMSLGTWTDTIPVGRADEIGQVCQAFNALGGQLTMTVQQFATASKLSALALLGHSLVRKIVVIRDHLQAVTGMVGLAKGDGREVPESVLPNLECIIASLQEIPAEFEVEFTRQMNQHRAQGTTRSGPQLEGRPGKSRAECGVESTHDGELKKRPA